jgi:hypothetical protein
MSPRQRVESNAKHYVGCFWFLLPVINTNAQNHFRKPVFTTTIAEESHRKCRSRVSSLLRYLEKQNVEGQQFVIDSKKVAARFLVEAIATAVFGSSCNEDDFMKVGNIIESIDSDLSSLNGSFRLLLSSCLPKQIKTKVFRREVDEFFVEMVHQKRRGLIEKLSGELDNNEVAAQLLILFAGG